MAFSQTRADTLVYIMNIPGGTPVEQRFFEENLKMEIPAAGYSITDDILEADYALSCSISDDEEESGRVVLFSLFDAKDEREIVSTDLFYTKTEETYEMLPFVIWSMFASAPLKQVTREVEIVEVEVEVEKEVPVYIEVIREVEKPALPERIEPVDTWKYRWIFINARLGASFRYYRADSSDKPSASILTVDAGIEPEVHLFDFLAVQLGINFALDKAEYQRSPANPTTIAYSTAILSVPLLVKYIFNPADRFTLGPYVGGYLSVPFMGTSRPPPVGVLAGLDLGAKMGQGTLLFDLRYSMDLGTTDVFDYKITYNRMFITLSAGYKFGLFRR
ncbi:hypothetical protein [Treponema primitia]|uniref:hypothetical protein n=1 Tax=Treponema primitia TaxID=88058 RepID=UPI00398191C5